MLTQNWGELISIFCAVCYTILVMVKMILLFNFFKSTFLYLWKYKPSFIFIMFTVGGYYNMDVNTKLKWANFLILRWMLQNCDDGEDDFYFNERKYNNLQNLYIYIQTRFLSSPSSLWEICILGVSNCYLISHNSRCQYHYPSHPLSQNLDLAKTKS